MSPVKWYIGIDEVGRGPLAGPITICAFATKERDPKFLRGIKDSKKLTEIKRKDWLKKITGEEKTGNVVFSVQSSDHGAIDDLGITEAVNLAIKEALKQLNIPPGSCNVLLDGGLKAPAEYIYQETIIKGDEKEKIIAAASIVAKVDRDSFMYEQAIKYPEYGFSEHKGYGTSAHYEAIKKHGLSKIHRRSFLSEFL